MRRNGAYTGGLFATLTGAGILPAWLPAAACGLLAWVADAQQESANEFYEDPSRPDFTSSTFAVPRRFYPEELGTTELERTLGEVAKTQLDAAAYVGATVRATERAMGAREREQFNYVDLRLAEARALATQASSTLRAGNGALGQLAELLSEPRAGASQDQERRPERGRIRASQRIDQALSANALALLYRTGVPIQFLRRTRVGSPTSKDGPSALIESMTSARGANEQFAAALEKWAPEWSQFLRP